MRKLHNTLIVCDSSISASAPPSTGPSRTNFVVLPAARTDDVVATARYWDREICGIWNEFARSLVARHRLNPTDASRVYVLLSIAQSDAAITALQLQIKFQRAFPEQAEPKRQNKSVSTSSANVYAYPSDKLTIASASATVLTYLFPRDKSTFADALRSLRESQLQIGAHHRSDLEIGQNVGEVVAKCVIARARVDGADSTAKYKKPASNSGEPLWDGRRPVSPHWGKTRPFTVADITKLRLPPPPAQNSAEFHAALAEVREIARNRTVAEFRLSHHWGDGNGSVTPPGRWNTVACNLIEETDKTPAQAAHILAVLNIALYDAGVCCWDTKFAYCLPRPTQMDKNIRPSMRVPDFPAYPSGHSMFSGAASEVLSRYFPNAEPQLRKSALDASISRLYGGFHYRFDCERGLEAGQNIAKLTLRRFGGIAG